MRGQQQLWEPTMPFRVVGPELWAADAGVEACSVSAGGPVLPAAETGNRGRPRGGIAERVIKGRLMCVVSGEGQDQHERPEPLGDPYLAHAERFAAFLEQAKWLLDQQQARGAAFQQNAAVLVGFDGVLLALLISGDALGNVESLSGMWWVGVVGASMVASSAVAGLLAIVPWSTYAVVSADTVKAWAKVQVEPSWDNSRYHFAHMLLAAAPPARGTATWPARFAHWWRERLGWKQPPTQALQSAERLATRRGRWTTVSAFLLVGGIVALVLVFFAASTEPAPSTMTPSPTAQSLSREV